jgi:uncharacterized protein (DUF1330 family)
VLPHGTQIEALEGNWKPDRIVLIEFDDADQARQWWDSTEYAEARAIHCETTISNIILVDGGSCAPNHEEERDIAQRRENTR